MADNRPQGADNPLSDSIDLLRTSTQLNGRVTLPGAFVKAKNITYGQPILVEVIGNGMTVIKAPDAAVAASWAAVAAVQAPTLVAMCCAVQVTIRHTCALQQ